MAEKLTNIERRVLGHLPAWAEDEAWHVENEGGPDVSIRFYTAPDFAARLGEDLATKHPQRGGPLTEAECVQVLNHLASRGLAEDRDGGWRMTEAGFLALTEPALEPEQLPGAVEVPVHPASAESEGVTG